MPQNTYKIAPSSGSGSSSSSQTGSVVSAISKIDRIGLNLLTPFRRGSNDFVSGGSEEAIETMISQVLGTRAGSDYTEGELRWRSDFGSLVHFVRHRNINEVTIEMLRVYTVEALSKWIPQIRVNRVEVSADKGPNNEYSVLVAKIFYDRIDSAGNTLLQGRTAKITFN